jgi:hypothetical protein
MMLRKDKTIRFDGKPIAECYKGVEFAAIVKNKGLILLDSFSGSFSEYPNGMRVRSTPVAIELSEKQVGQLETVIDTWNGLEPGKDRTLRRAGLDVEISQDRMLLYNRNTFTPINILTVVPMASFDKQKIPWVKEACSLYREQKDHLAPYKARDAHWEVTSLLRQYAAERGREDLLRRGGDRFA